MKFLSTEHSDEHIQNLENGKTLFYFHFFKEHTFE